jgi:hypothetical protein
MCMTQKYKEYGTYGYLYKISSGGIFATPLSHIIRKGRVV